MALRRPASGSYTPQTLSPVRQTQAYQGFWGDAWDFIKDEVIPEFTGGGGPGGPSVIPGPGENIVPGGGWPRSGGREKNLVAGGTGGDCPGAWSVRGPGGTCIDLTALPPGGDPAVTGGVQLPGGSDGYGAAVRGLYGVGIQPRVEAQTVRRCPPGTALGKDGVCYEGLHRNSPKRAWPMGMKPLMTGGDRAAIRKAASAAAKLGRAKKTLSKASKALGKVC